MVLVGLGCGTVTGGQAQADAAVVDAQLGADSGELGADGGELADATPRPDADPSLCNSMLAFEDGVGSLRDIWVAGPGGGGRFNVSAHVADDMRPSWLADGRVLFISERARQRDAWVVDTAGRGLVNLTASIAERVERADSSPDGSLIAFVRGEDTPDNSVWVMRTDGSEPRQVSALPYSGGPLVWSPDGTRLLYAHKNGGGGIPDIVLATVAGGEPVKLAATAAMETVTRGAWSPDGRRVVFHRFRDVWVVDADGRNPLNLTPNSTANDYEPHFTLDAASVVFSSDRAGIHRLYKVDASGGTPMPLTAPMGDVGSFGDAPTEMARDGVHVLFGRSTRTGGSSTSRGAIGTVKLDGHEEYTFDTDATGADPTWSPCLEMTR